MIKFYSGRFNTWYLYVRDSFINIHNNETYYDIYLYYVKGIYPEIEMEGDEWDEKIIFKTPKYWLQLTNEGNGTVTLQLLDVGIDRAIICIRGFPYEVAESLKAIAQNCEPAYGIKLRHDPFAYDDYSDSGYTGSDDSRSAFSDTSY